MTLSTPYDDYAMLQVVCIHILSLVIILILSMAMFLRCLRTHKLLRFDVYL